MTRTEFIIATTIILSAAFLLGWLACWLLGRLTRPADPGALSRMARDLNRAENERDLANLTLRNRESELTARLAASETELQTTLEVLRESATEVEELRAYIERKLSRR